MITFAFWNGAVYPKSPVSARVKMREGWCRLLGDDGQDVAEYAVMLAVILAVVVGTIRMIGSNANNVFSSVGSAIQ
jgi:Flp pilus assembly pilin Flp